MTIDEKALAEYEAICAVVPAGTYFRETHEEGDEDGPTGDVVVTSNVLCVDNDGDGSVYDVASCDSPEIADWLVASRTMGPALCAALRAERATVARLRAGLSALRDRFRDEDYRATCIIDEAMRDAETAQSAKGGES